MKTEEIKKQYAEMLNDWEDEETVPAAVNKLLSAIKESLPYWEKRIQGTDFNEDDLIFEFMTKKDSEVQNQIRNLIKTIRREESK